MNTKANVAANKSVSHMDICLYIPNLIGYFRFITNMIAMYYAFDSRDG